jgi:hypothetical protein
MSSSGRRSSRSHATGTPRSACCSPSAPQDRARRLLADSHRHVRSGACCFDAMVSVSRFPYAPATAAQTQGCVVCWEVSEAWTALRALVEHAPRSGQ